MNCFAFPLIVRSRGWKKCVMFAGTDTTTTFSDANFEKTLSLFLPMNTSQTSSAFYVGCSLSSLHFPSTHGLITLFIILLFLLHLNNVLDSVKWRTCWEKKSPESEITKVRVIFLLTLRPFIKVFRYSFLETIPNFFNCLFRSLL